MYRYVPRVDGRRFWRGLEAREGLRLAVTRYRILAVRQSVSLLLSFFIVG